MEEMDLLQNIRIADIKPNPYQPRKIFDDAAIGELAASMKKDGLVQPIVVRRSAEGIILVAGERRMRAALTLAWSDIPAIIKTMSETQAAAASIIENIQRVNNNPVEIADAISAMIERSGITQQDAAKILGVTQPKVAQLLSLTRLTDDIRDGIVQGSISQSVGRIVAGLDPSIQKALHESLPNMSAERAQHFVNVYKGLAEVGGSQEDDADAVDLRLYKRLYGANHVDLYASTWATVNEGFKTIQLDKIKGASVSSYFIGFSLFQRLGLNTYTSSSKKLVYKLFEKSRDAAVRLAEEILQAADSKQQVSEEGRQSDLSEYVEVPSDERKEAVLSRLREYHTNVLEWYGNAKGTAQEQSYETLRDEVEVLLDGDIEEVHILEAEMNTLLEMGTALHETEQDPELLKHLNTMREAFDSSRSAEEQFKNTDFEEQFRACGVKIAHALGNHLNYNSWELPRMASEFWREVKDKVEEATLSVQGRSTASEEDELAGRAIAVLNPKPEKTKTNRILQLLQEGTEEHELSVRCRNCQYYDDKGNTYRERCKASGISFHSFRRYMVEGMDCFSCSEYTPRTEVVLQKKQSTALDMVTSLFELLVYEGATYSKQYPSLTWAKKEIPELRDCDCSPEKVVGLFVKQDEQTKAYWIEVFQRRYQLVNAMQKNLPHPVHLADGRRFMVGYNSMENDEV